MFLQIAPSLGTALVLYRIPAKNNFVEHLQWNTKNLSNMRIRQHRPRNFLIKYCYGCKALPTGVARTASNFSPFPFPVAAKTALLPKSHPLHRDRCKARSLPKIHNIRIFHAWLWNWRWGEGSSAQQLWRAHTANFNPIAASPWNKRKWFLSVLNNTCCPFSWVSGRGGGSMSHVNCFYKSLPPKPVLLFLIFVSLFKESG